MVTGAAGAIGTAVVKSFILSGAEVVAIDINKSGLEELILTLEFKKNY